MATNGTGIGDKWYGYMATNGTEIGDKWYGYTAKSQYSCGFEATKLWRQMVRYFFGDMLDRYVAIWYYAYEKRG